MHSALFTDFYELTMAQGYWKHDRHERAVFDLFFRRNPFEGGYSVFAGLDPLLRALEEFCFSQEDLAWLESLGMFERGFLDYLSSFRFRGSVWSLAEGEIIFPQVPMLRFEADLIEAQLIEGLALNIINFQSLIATKAARIWRASNQGSIMEFGLRRAQGPDGALSAARAAYIGGASSTSNSLAGKLYGIPVMGTMAHSWVMSFAGEREAFDAYAAMYPDKTVYLIDTYDTLKSGIGQAIESGRKLAAAGKRFGVRLDSGDIDYLSREVRRRLDEAGLKDAYIVVSNELDERIIERLVADKAPVDLWGVGTHLVTGGSESSFTGVYKLAAVERDKRIEPTMKFSDNPQKATNPGIKQAWRLYDELGRAMGDLITLEDESIEAGREHLLHHPAADWRKICVVPAKTRQLLFKAMEGGKSLDPRPSLEDARGRLRGEFPNIDGSYLRMLNPHIYKVSISEKIRSLKLGFIERYMKSQGPVR